ncbi:MAG: SRPBCC family protein [Burkholderiaceae bacterium]
MKSAYGRHAEASAVLAATPAAAFAFLDDHRRLSSHMESSSMMMAGSAMKIETDEFRGQEIGSRIRTAGHALGLALAVEQVVIERDPPWRKTWETVGQPRLLVIGAYRMGFVVQPDAAGSRVTVWIDYAPPKGNALLGRLFGRVYARWCTARMAHDAAARLEPAAPQVWRQ